MKIIIDRLCFNREDIYSWDTVCTSVFESADVHYRVCSDGNCLSGVYNKKVDETQLVHAPHPRCQPYALDTDELEKEIKEHIKGICRSEGE